ncbi:hypothetical protein JMJ77_0005759 [Colletotrichum scovillei]|uniref:Uncharacterized protein n=1 Tax=Colletotrichum scovillei TaxID=1209932 RepID=A0A9P7RJX2_9PEZI|nr:hypothetical protein JMJ77_0005759 [Colletotrichum scovillei]KAG7076962.1 hypothetical protein JMJ76_0014218 [Colletotrichum scovillei]KAG7084101.1 hypothetical protein JMJ78_0009541 [Colletotrichum scovillei]
MHCWDEFKRSAFGEIGPNFASRMALGRRPCHWLQSYVFRVTLFRVELAAWGAIEDSLGRMGNVRSHGWLRVGRPANHDDSSGTEPNSDELSACVQLRLNQQL